MTVGQAIRVATVLLLPSALVVMPSAARAHDGVRADPSIEPGLAFWASDPLPLVMALIAAIGYLLAVRSVNRAHPGNRVSAWRTTAWLAGLAVILVALESPLDALADDLLTAHMTQHLLLAMVAPPLLALAAPVTLALRAASGPARRGLLLPLLHTRAVRMLASPLLAWIVFGAVMWFAHFSPLYEAALDSPAIHAAEHALFLVSGLLFWWPVVGADPVPGRWRWGARLAYVLSQMPVNAAVGLALYFTSYVVYPHYASTTRAWGLDPLTDQQIAGLVMWGAGDLALLAAFMGLAAAWIRSELRRDRRLAARLVTTETEARASLQQR